MQRSTTSFSSLRASTLRVEAVETFVVDLPIIRPHLLSVATMQAQTLMIVKIVCSDGITGFGEGTTIGGLVYGAESPEGMKLAIDRYIAPILKSANPARVPETMIAIRKAIKGNNFAKCAVETALLDAWGKRVGLPMSELVGGRLRDRLPVAWTLASGDTAIDIAEAEQMLDRKRHNAFKLKIGRRSIDEDVAHVAAIKRALGNTRQRASRRQYGVERSRGEQGACRSRSCRMRPRRAAGRKSRPRSHGSLPASTFRSWPTNLCRDRKRPSRSRARAPRTSSRSRSPNRAVSTKPAESPRSPTLQVSGSMAERCSKARSARLPAPTSFQRSRTLTWGTELFGPLLLTEELVTEPLQYQDFELAVPTGPGLGIELDDDRLRFFQRDGERRSISTAPARAGR